MCREFIDGESEHWLRLAEAESRSARGGSLTEFVVTFEEVGGFPRGTVDEERCAVAAVDVEPESLHESLCRVQFIFNPAIRRPAGASTAGTGVVEVSVHHCRELFRSPSAVVGIVFKTVEFDIIDATVVTEVGVGFPQFFEHCRVVVRYEILAVRVDQARHISPDSVCSGIGCVHPPSAIGEFPHAGVGLFEVSHEDDLVFDPDVIEAIETVEEWRSESEISTTSTQFAWPFDTWFRSEKNRCIISAHWSGYRSATPACKSAFRIFGDVVRIAAPDAAAEEVEFEVNTFVEQMVGEPAEILHAAGKDFRSQVAE